MAAPRKTAAPRKAPARKAAAPKRKAAPASTGAVQTEAAPAAPDATTASGMADALSKLYPKGTPVWVFTAADGTEIPFPKFSSVPPPDRAFFWQLYQMDTMFQGFEWMRYAAVPDEIQAIAVQLPEKDYQALFDGWFDAAKLTAGE